MKTKFNYLVILFIQILLVSCGNKSVNLPNTDNDQPNRNNKLLAEVKVDGKPLLRYQYDENNSVVLAEVYEDGEAIYDMRYTYNSAGKIKEIKQGELYKLQYEYDNQTNLLHINEYLDNAFRQKYTLSRESNKAKLKAIDQEGNRTEITAYYDADGNITKLSNVITGNYTYSYTSEWGDYDNQLAAPSEADGLLSLLVTTPNNPRTFKIVNSLEPNKVHVEKYQYTYTDEGYPLTKKTFNANGTLTESWTYHYINKK